MSLIAEDLREEFHLQRWVRTEDSGRREVFGPLESHPCRWQPGARLVKDVGGKPVVATGTLFTTARVGPEELKRLRLWLPGEDPTDIGLSRVAAQVFVRKDLETGAFDHSEVVI